MLLDLPPELLQLIFQHLEDRDLWELFNVSNSIRPNVARCLFQHVEIDYPPSNFPESLNGKPLPATRIFQLLGQWLPLIQDVRIFCYRAVEPCMLNLLSRLPNIRRCCIDAERNDESSYGVKEQLADQPGLRELFHSSNVPSSWPVHLPFRSLHKLVIEYLSSGTLVIPAMPALLDLDIQFDDGFTLNEMTLKNWDCTVLVDFTALPSLSRLGLEHLHLGNMVFCGHPDSLKTFEVNYSKGELNDILSIIGIRLEQLIVGGSHVTCQALTVDLLSLKKVHLKDSSDIFPFLLENELPALEEIIWEITSQGEFRGFDFRRRAFTDDNKARPDVMQWTKNNGSLTSFFHLAEQISCGDSTDSYSLVDQILWTAK